MSTAFAYYAENLGHGSTFEFMTEKQTNQHEQNPNPQLLSLVAAMILVLVFVIFVEVRVEFENRRTNDGRGLNFEGVRRNINALRLGMLIMIVVAIIEAWQRMFGFAKDPNLSRLRVHVFNTSLVCVLLPLIFILRSPNIKNFVTK